MSKRNVSPVIGYQQITAYGTPRFPITFPRSEFSTWFESMPERTYFSWTCVQRRVVASLGFSPVNLQRVFDEKTKMEFLVLNVQKDRKAIDNIEGILSKLAQKLIEQNIEPADLVKKVWKTSE